MSKKTTVINPYKNAISSSLEFVRKLKWDLTLNSIISRKNLSFLENSHKNEKAVIVCNGPSLRNMNLDELEDVFTFGLNKINLLFEYSKFRPSCIVAVNKFVIEQNRDFFRSTEIPHFLDSNSALRNKLFSNSKRILLFSSNGYPGFSSDPRYAVSQGSTVTYVAMQLAYYMGFKEITLIGCDHNFQTKGPAHKVVIGKDSDKNHFDERYFSKGAKWQLPSIAESEESYLKAKSFFESDNRKIYNSTDGGKLELFERIKLSDFLSK